MIQALRKWWTKASKDGLHLPFAYDAATGEPSMTLLFPYLSFIVAITSVVTLHFLPNILVPTLTSIGFFALCYVLYRIRRIDKAKFDLDDRSIELESGEDEKAPPPVSKDE